MFELIKLPYKSLAPVISDETLSFHYGKHLQTYVDNLNKLVPGTEYEGKSLEEIVMNATGAIFNNAGQILNHNLYFTQFAPQPSQTAPTGKLASQIDKQWGSFEVFKADFEQKGTDLFGSGWVWLAAEKDGTLVINKEPNADNPVTKAQIPLLTFDVWEHAYYLDYQNRRAAHLKELWKIVDWEVIEGRYI